MTMTQRLSMTHIQRRGGSVDAELHYTTCRMMNGNASEWLRMIENDSHPRRMGGVVVILCGYVHYTTCTRLNENSSDYPIIDEHVCDDTA